MAHFWKRFLAGVITICRMIFLVCAGDIGIIISAVFVAFLTTNIAGVVLSASEVTATARTEIAIVVPILTIDMVLLGSILPRIREVARPDRQHRSLIYALVAGLVLLLLKSAWQGLDKASYSFSATSVLLILTTCIIAPISEELFFRGYLWLKLRTHHYNDKLIVFCTTVLYIIPHVPNSLSAFLDYAIIGIFLGFIRYFSGGILLSCAFHMAMNFIVISGI